MYISLGIFAFALGAVGKDIERFGLKCVNYCRRQHRRRASRAAVAPASVKSGVEYEKQGPDSPGLTGSDGAVYQKISSPSEVTTLVATTPPRSEGATVA